MTTTPHLEPVAARFDLRSPCPAARPWWSAVASATQVAVARAAPCAGGPRRGVRAAVAGAAARGAEPASGRPWTQP